MSTLTNCPTVAVSYVVWEISRDRLAARYADEATARRRAADWKDMCPGRTYEVRRRTIITALEALDAID